MINHEKHFVNDKERMNLAFPGKLFNINILIKKRSDI